MFFQPKLNYQLKHLMIILFTEIVKLLIENARSWRCTNINFYRNLNFV
jgi:hypothetical protein